MMPSLEGVIVIFYAFLAGCVHGFILGTALKYIFRLCNKIRGYFNE